MGCLDFSVYVICYFEFKWAPFNLSSYLGDWGFGIVNHVRVFTISEFNCLQYFSAFRLKGVSTYKLNAHLHLIDCEDCIIFLKEKIVFGKNFG